MMKLVTYLPMAMAAVTFCSQAWLGAGAQAQLPPFAQEAYVKASNTGKGDRFGSRVALSGDTLAVGADGENSAATGVNGNQANNSAKNSGAVYVFTRDNTGVWSQQAYVKSSNTSMDDLFGFSVALDGDTLAVGAVSESVNTGAVYVFTRTNGVWSQQAYLKGSNTEVGDAFGSSVALAGDTLAVGAIQEDSAATGVNGNQADNSAHDSGAVYVFTRDNTGVWSQQAYVKASNTGADDRFGISVALAGDSLAVGSDREDSAATGINGDQANNSAGASGAVYVFTRQGGIWSQQAYVKASNTEADDRFGISVALAGDSLAVGGPFEDSAATGINGDQANNSAGASGAVYVFTRDNTGIWSQQAYVKASNTQFADLFGFSVALDGDTLAVGAYGENSAATGVNGNQADNSVGNSGAVYVFTRTNGVWSQQAYVKASNTGKGDRFGSRVALAGDTLAVGSWREDSAATGVNGNQADNSAPNSGAVYIYRAQ